MLTLILESARDTIFLHERKQLLGLFVCGEMVSHRLQDGIQRVDECGLKVAGMDVARTVVGTQLIE